MAKQSSTKSSKSGVVAVLLVVAVLGGYAGLKYGGVGKTKSSAVPKPDAQTEQSNQAQIQGVANVLPRECLAAAILNLDGVQTLFDEAGAGRIRQDPRWGPYWNALMAQMPDDGRLMYQIGQRLFQRELALACLDVDAREATKPGYLPPLVMVGALAPGTAVLPGYIQSQLERAEPQTTVRATPYAWEGVDLIRVVIGRSTFYGAVVGKAKIDATGQNQTPYLAVSWRPDTAARFALQKPEDKRLGENREFAALARRLEYTPGQQPLFAFCDLGTMKEQVYSVLARQSRRDSLVEWQFLKTRRLVDFLGLQELQGIGVALVQSTDGVRTRTYCHLTGLKGIVKVFVVPEGEIQGTSFYPPNTVLCNLWRLDASTVWRTLRQELSGIDLNLMHDMDAFLSNTKLRWGFDPELLVLSLGEEVGYGIVAGESLNAPYQTLVTLRTKDSAIVRAAVRLAGQLGVPCNEMAVGDETMHVFGRLEMPEGAPMPQSVQPVLAYVDGFTLLGTSTAVVRAAIEARRTGNDVTTAPDWDAFFERLPEARDGIGYVSSTYRDCLLTFLPQRPRMFDLNPHAELFTASASVVDYGLNGLFSESFSPSGSDVLLTGLSVLAALPDVFHWKEYWLDFQTQRVLEQVAQAKERIAKEYNLVTGTVVTADGTGRNTYDLVVAGYLPATPTDPRTARPIVIGPIGSPPHVPAEGEVEETQVQPPAASLGPPLDEIPAEEAG